MFAPRLFPTAGARPLQSVVKKHALPASTIFTDEWPAYHGLDRDYKAHNRIRHSEEIYVEGNVHTNTIEGFFGLIKNGIRGRLPRRQHRLPTESP